MELLVFCILVGVLLYFGFQEYKKRSIKPKGYCPKCGVALVELCDFCPKCGFQLKEEKEVPKVVEVPKSTGTDFFLGPENTKTENLTKEENNALCLEININSMITEVEVQKFPCLIGRVSGQCDLLIEEPAVGRKHALLEKVNEKYFITDMKSVNGTYVNGLKIETEKRFELHKSDSIKIGRAVITII